MPSCLRVRRGEQRSRRRRRQSLLKSLRDECVDRHRRDDREAVEEDLPELVEAKQREPVGDRRDEDGAEHDAEDRPGAAEDVDSADHDGSDDRELEAVCSARVERREPRCEEEAPRPARAPDSANAVMTRGRPESRRNARRLGWSRSHRSPLPTVPSGALPRRRAQRRPRSTRAPESLRASTRRAAGSDSAAGTP